jgi:hypothetical protein
MNMSTYQKILPDLMQDATIESAAGRTSGAMLDSMCRVMSLCLPIFDRAMQSLAESSAIRSPGSR